jgi:hypothetical protein
MFFPTSFVWSRFGTEAGQTIDSILRRKEQERVANGGVFYWGIGNAVGPSVAALVSQSDRPEVLFSPIKSPARSEDAQPRCVLAWTAAIGLNGEPYALPLRSLITSRFAAGRQYHYALVCNSDLPLTDALNRALATSDGIFRRDLCNFLTGRPVGASQVTAVVQRRAQHSASGTAYPVSFRAKLVPPYFIRLSIPLPISREHVSHWAVDRLRTSPEGATV